MYKTRTYKTMRGLLNACGRNGKQVEANVFFDSSRGFLCHNNGVFFYAKPSDDLRAAKAKEFEACHWARRDADRTAALSSGCGADYSYLQSFYIGLSAWSSNSLSGEAYDYCRRKFTQSARR